MTLLTIVAEAAGSLNQPVPTAIFGSTTGDAILWRNLAQRAGKELARAHDWYPLYVDRTALSVAQAVQTGLQSGTFGVDYDRLPYNPEMWNRDLDLKYIGPTDDSTWNLLQATGISTSPGNWRYTSSGIEIYPTPAAGQTLHFPFISNKWCQSSGAVTQSAWAADTDTARISEDLLSLSLTWRWLRAKGMDYAEEMATYEREKEKAAARDRGVKPLIVGGGSWDYPEPTWAGTIVV